MKINSEPKLVQSMINGREKLNLNPGYQRNPVWKEAKKQLLLDSILRGYDLPKFYFHELSNNKYDFDVIDGQQRLRSIFDFIDGKINLGKMSADLPDGDLSGKSFLELDTPIKDKVTGFQLTISQVREAEREEIAELFKRLQDGVQLSAAERRNAVISDLGIFIKETTKKYPVFTNSTQLNDRFMLDEYAASVLSIELEGGATEINSNSLLKLYENHRKFDVENKKIKKFEKILNYMSNVFHKPAPELKNKYSFIDFYLLISFLDGKYALKGLEDEFFSAFTNFETERKDVGDWLDFANTGSLWDKDLYEYQDAYLREGNRKINIEKRHQVYLKRFIRDIDHLTPIDTNRLFNSHERIILWRKANQLCKSCNDKVEFADMHADHIISHSKGGKTLISNGQCLCQKCNLSKSNK